MGKQVKYYSPPILCCVFFLVSCVSTPSTQTPVNTQKPITQSDLKKLKELDELQREVDLLEKLSADMSESLGQLENQNRESYELLIQAKTEQIENCKRKGCSQEELQGIQADLNRFEQDLRRYSQ